MSELVQLNAQTPEVPSGKLSSWGDWVGMVASIGCAIHCAAMPFVIASLPALGLSFLADEAFHKWMALVCFLIAIAAFVPGWRKHRRLLPAIVGLVGLTMISGAAFGLAGECCPSCEAAAANVVAAGDTSATCTDESCELCSAEVVAIAKSAESTCTEESCEFCAAEAEKSAVVESITESDASCTDESCESCNTQKVEVADSTTAEASCTDECCEVCAAESIDSDDSDTAESDAEATTQLAGFSLKPNALLSRIAPFLTPVGGLILVGAHLLNRRYGCLCGCCE